MSILVRKMRKSDSAAWADMRLRLWEGTSPSEHLSEIEKILKSRKDSGYVALLDGDRPAGFAEISIRGYANGCKEQPVPFLEGIWVEPGCRRQGVGRALIEKITSDLVSRGFRELCSDAEIGNRRSRHTHQSWGFDESERVVYFRKQLT